MSRVVAIAEAGNDGGGTSARPELTAALTFATSATIMASTASDPRDASLEAKFTLPNTWYKEATGISYYCRQHCSSTLIIF